MLEERLVRRVSARRLVACLTRATDPVHERPRPLRAPRRSRRALISSRISVSAEVISAAVVVPSPSQAPKTYGSTGRRRSEYWTRPASCTWWFLSPRTTSVRWISSVVTIPASAVAVPPSVLVRGLPFVRRVADDGRAVREDDLLARTSEEGRCRAEHHGRLPVGAENNVAVSDLRHEPPSLAGRYLRVERERLSLEPCHEVVGQRHPLERRAEDELPGVEDERLRRPRPRRARSAPPARP